MRMSINIVSLIMQYLAPSLVGRIASSFGLEQTLAQKAIGAAVPAILSGLIGKASSADGARQLSTSLSQQDPGLLGNLAGMLGGGSQASLISGGTSALTSLLGGSALGALTGAVGKFAGIGEAPTKNLLGVLGPVVLGTLGQQQKRSGLDASGLASMLAGQKDNIASAMPAGFSQLLSGSGLLDQISGNLKGAASTATAAAGAAAATAKSAATAASSIGGAAASAAAKVPASLPTSQFRGFPIWLLALAAIAGILSYTWFTDTSRMATVGAPQKIVVGGVDLAGQMTSAVAGLKTSLGTIKDAASAQSALPKLRDAAGQIEKIQGLSGQLPADGKKSLSGMAAAALKTLEPIITAVLGTTGVGPVVKPTLDALRGRLEAMAKA